MQAFIFFAPKKYKKNPDRIGNDVYSKIHVCTYEY